MQHTIIRMTGDIIFNVIYGISNGATIVYDVIDTY